MTTSLDYMTIVVYVLAYARRSAIWDTITNSSNHARVLRLQGRVTVTVTAGCLNSSDDR